MYGVREDGDTRWSSVIKSLRQASTGTILAHSHRAIRNRQYFIATLIAIVC
jgi:hypothetical protein